MPPWAAMTSSSSGTGGVTFERCQRYGRITPLTTPCRRALAGGAAELPAQMRLVGEAAGQCQLTERGVAGEHQPAHPLDAAAHQVSMGGLAENLTEGSGEMGPAEADQIAEVLDPYRFGQMLVDERLDALDLPGGEAAGVGAAIGGNASIDLDLQQGGGAGDAGFRRLAIPLHFLGG